jgi:hypothetical protein
MEMQAVQEQMQLQTKCLPTSTEDLSCRGADVQMFSRVLRGCISSAEVVQSRCSSCEVQVQEMGAGGQVLLHRCIGVEVQRFLVAEVQ